MKTESVLGFLAGAAVGALAGILFAPEAEVLGHKAEVRYRYARREMNALKKTLMEQGEELKEEARKTLMEKLDQLEKYFAHEEGEEEVDEQPQEA